MNFNQISCSVILSAALLYYPLSAAASDSSYYPTSFLQKISSPSSNDNIKTEVFKVLAWKHKSEVNAQDTIYEKCPTGASCYQQLSTMTYSNARTLMFGDIDLIEKENGALFLRDVYCHINYDKNDGVGRMRIPDPEKINCEHTWPQSRFSKYFPAELQKTDLHHLFSAQNRANSIRGNYIFAEVDGDVASKDCMESYFGNAVGTTTTAFEPPAEHKGNVARALFYFSARYQLPISEIEEGYLRQWHVQDPIDAAEMQRNEKIFAIQKNRNPFIDYPQLVDLISDF